MRGDERIFQCFSFYQIQFAFAKEEASFVVWCSQITSFSITDSLDCSQTNQIFFLFFFSDGQNCLNPFSPFLSLCQAFHEEYSRLYELSQEEATPQEDARLQHALVYFFQNRAPKRIIERTLLEQFTDRNLSFDERYALLTRRRDQAACL